MALTELKIKSLAPTNKIQKISDGGGLVLFINPKGNKYWRYNFRFENKQKTLSIGVYPAVSLARTTVLTSSLLKEDTPILTVVS